MDLTAWLLLALAALLAIITGVLYTIKLDASIKLRKTYCKVLITFRVFYMIIPIRIRLRIDYEPMAGVIITSYRQDGSIKYLKTVGDKSEPRNAAADRIVKKAVEFVDIKYLEISGEVGIKGDSFKSVMLCGFVINLLSVALPFLLQQTGFSGGINVFPCFTRNAFSLNLEGIAQIKSLKLIKTAIEEKGDRTYDTADRKLNADLNGTN